MQKITVLAITFMTIVGIPIRALTAPTIREKTNYYYVSGRTAIEIRNNLNRVTPVQYQGRSYDGYTKWFVKWNFWWDRSHDSCKITDVKISVDVETTLPKIKNIRNLPEPLRKKWATYITALVSHENVHKNHGIQAGYEIEQVIANMQPRKTCQQLKIDANQLGYNIIRQYNNLDREFDRKTNHGAKNGAVFP